MSQKAEYLQLEPTDDVTTVRDRLAFLRGKRVLLIWPEDGTVLTRKLDLVLIQREAIRNNVRLAIVTHDPQVTKQAREMRISVFETIGASERGRWRRGRAKVFISRDDRPTGEPEPKELKPIAGRVKEAADEDDEPKPRARLARLVALLVLLLVAAAVAVIVAPSATVTITPSRSLIPAQVQVVADPDATDVDIENRVVPAVTLRVEIEETGTLPTTGARSLSDVPASGSVVFINQTNNEIEIPIETTVSTSAGTPILFRTTAAAVAPAQLGGQIEVPVEALPGSGGAAGNVDAGLINTIVGPLAETLTVRNVAPTAGGESRTLKAVSQDDRDRLLSTLRQQLQSRAYVAMEAQRAPTQTIILETIRVVEDRDEWMTWSANVGDAADALTLTMRAVVEASAIDEALARQIAFAAVAAQIPPGRALVPESIDYDCCTVQGIDAEGRVMVGISGAAQVAGQINTSALAEQLAGRETDDAARFLLSEVDLADNTRPEIQVSPDWFGRLPFLPTRIQLQVLEAPL